MNSLHVLFDWLVAASLRASALTLLVLAIQWILKRRLSPRWRYALWLPVLIVLLAPVLPESRWSIESVFQAKQQIMELRHFPVVADVAPVSLPVIAQPVMSPLAPVNWPQIRVMTWALGTSLLLLIGGVSFLRTLLRFRRSRQSVSHDLLSQIDSITLEVGLRRSPQVLVAPEIQSPAVTGLLRPTLLLPAGFESDFTAEEARLILQHELTHLKRHDLPLNTLLCVLMALHWFNPLLWLAFFMARADREAACDAQVLENATPQRRSEYGHALLKIETSFAPLRLCLGFVGMLQRGAALRARIRSIAAPTRTRPLSGLLATLCIACMTFLGVTRAEKSSDGEKMESMIAIEVKIVQFNQPTDWNFGGRLSSRKTDLESGPFTSEVLSRPEHTKLVRELVLRKDLTLTSYPRMVTPNGKEVIIRNVVNQPFEEAKGKVAYLPVGLVMKLVPTLGNGKLTMPTHITDSKIVKHEPLVASSRVFQNILESDEGTSHVIVTWEEGKAQSRQPILYIITPSRFQPGNAEHSISPTSKAEASPKRVSKEPKVGADAFLANKLDHIILPRVVFKDASLEDAIDFLRLKSRALDTTTTDEKRKGVPILVRKGEKPAGTVTIDLTDVPLKEALKYVTELAGCQYRLTPYAVIVEQTGGPKLPPASKPAAKLTGAMPKGGELILPQVEFRDVTLADALDFIRVKARNLDPAKKGVNIVVKPGAGENKALITMSLKDIPVSEALRYIAGLSNQLLTADAQSFYLTPEEKEPSESRSQGEASKGKTR
ncbi:MAG: M56 family metallopeptidase [Prosthecobacter sp.]